MAERIGVTTINNATGNLKFPRVSVKAIGTEEGKLMTRQTQVWSLMR